MCIVRQTSANIAVPRFSCRAVTPSAYTREMYSDGGLWDRAEEDLEDFDWVSEAWVRGNLFWVDWEDEDQSTALEGFSSFNEIFQERLEQPIKDWVSQNYPDAPKLGPVPPIDNSNSNFGRGLVFLMVIAGLVGAGMFGPIAFLAVIPGIFLFWGFSKVERTTPEQALSQHKREHQVKVEQWASARQNFSERLTGYFRWRAAVGVGEILDVPERLWQEFADWLLSNSELSRPELEQDLQTWIQQPKFPPGPSPVPDGVTHEEYEDYCRQVVVSWGYLDAKTSRYVRDGGIDIESEELVIQCKHISGNVRAPEVQAIFGIASSKGKRAVVFSAGGFTKDAISFANEAGVALIRLRERDAQAVPKNSSAEELIGDRTSFTPLPATNGSNSAPEPGKMSLLERVIGFARENREDEDTGENPPR